MITMLKKARSLGGMVFLLMMMLLTPVRALAQSPSAIDEMVRGNQLYEQGRFAEAAETYQALVEAGIEDGTLFYNLGNAYFKQGEWGQAILNYRRAQRLAPRDTDIRTNLLLARSQTVDQIDVEGEGVLSRLIRIAQNWLTLNEMAIAALGLWIVFFLLLILFFQLKAGGVRQMIFYLLIVSAIFLVGGLFSLGGRLYIENVRPEGVIMVEEVDATSGPGGQYIVEFTLHNGTEVSIIEERNNWVRLMLPGGQLQGWVPATAVARINLHKSP